MKVYFDNAATTPIDTRVIDLMTAIMQNDYGNPSSIHGHGRHIKSIIEQARRTVASILNASPTEIFFTSGGTESDNMAIVSAVENLDVQNIISTRIEHPAVLETLNYLENTQRAKIHFLNVNKNGIPDLLQLERLLEETPKTLVSLMHANNEIGALIDLQKVSEICQKHNAYFHSDTVQSVGHEKFDLKQLSIDFITGSAHKFHGPKGVGFIYINRKNKVHSFIHGGGQERNMRGGTENVYGIAGLAEALKIAAEEREENHSHVLGIKRYMIEKLKGNFPGVLFNGNSDSDTHLCTVLNVAFPYPDLKDYLLLNLDMKGISASGGSACSSGSLAGSHVLSTINADHEKPNIRFSFSKYNTKEEVDHVISILKEICAS